MHVFQYKMVIIIMAVVVQTLIASTLRVAVTVVAAVGCALVGSRSVGRSIAFIANARVCQIHTIHVYRTCYLMHEACATSI